MGLPVLMNRRLNESIMAFDLPNGGIYFSVKPTCISRIFMPLCLLALWQF